MKKLTLLLIPALLALTACQKGGGSSEPVNPSSSGELPSSESSSEEPAPIPSIDALLGFLENDSFTVDCAQKEYEGAELTDSEISQVRKDGTRDNLDVEYLIPVGSERRAVELETFYFVHAEGDDITMYYQENGFWISSSMPTRRVMRYPIALEMLNSISFLAYDINANEEYTWTYDEEAATYHGVSDGLDAHSEVSFELCSGFFSRIEVLVEYTEEEVDHTIITTITASEHNTTEVELPATPVSEIFDAMCGMFNVLKNASSFTVERDIHVVEGDYSQNIVFYVTYDSDIEQIDVKAIINNAYVYYYRQTYDEGSYSYAYRTPATDWTSMTDEEFSSAISGAFEICNFVNCQRPDSLARAIIELIECVPGTFSFKMGDIGEDLDLSLSRRALLLTTLTCTYNPSTYEMRSVVAENAEVRRSYTVTNINKTIID